MGVWGFVRKHTLPSVAMTIGFAWAMIGFASNAYEVWTAGFKPWQVQASGAAIFMLGVVATLYQFHQANEARFSAPEPSGPELKTTLSAPVVIPPEAAPQDPVAPPKSLANGTEPPVPPARPDREYLPKSFVQRYLDLLRGRHTDMQVSALLSDHTGQWMRISAFIIDISPSSNVVQVYLAQRKEAEASGKFFVYFSKHWTSHLARLGPHDPIEFDVQIVEHDHQRLQNAELL